MAQTQTTGTKLVGSGGVGSSLYQGYGAAVSANGVVLASGGNGDNSNAGAVWVFTLNTGTGAYTQQGSKLVGSGWVGTPSQGYSVALSTSGSVLASGGWNDNSGVGAVWVFTLAGGTYTQQGSKIVGTGAVGYAYLGITVALSASGSVLAAGGYGDNSYAGAVWVFTVSGGVYAQQGSKLVGSGAVGAANQARSISMSADGSIIASGGSLDNSNAGAVWVFTFNSGSGVFVQQGSKLVGSGATNPANQGWSVALSGNGLVLASGAYSDNSNVGAVWIFTRNGGTYVQQGSKIVGTGAVGAARQGGAVSLSYTGVVLASGATYDNSQAGARWVFTLNTATGVYSQYLAKFVGGGAVDPAHQGFPVSLSANGTVLLSGGYNDNAGIGAVWMFSISPIPTCLRPANTISTTYSSQCISPLPNGTLCTPVCVSGYTANASLTTMCLMGSFTTPLGTCNPNPCSTPTNSSSTNYSSCLASIPSGQSCTPVCYTGYTANASLTMNCLAGSFSSSGKCNPNPCVRPSDTSSTIYNQVSCASPTLSGTTCTPACASGYTANASLAMLCTLGNYSLPAGVCNPNPCNIPANTGSTNYASYCLASTPSGQSCTPVCYNGYTANASLTMNCSLGSFSTSSGKCNPNPCVRPSDTSSTIYNQASCASPTLSGTICTPTCVPGYTANGSLALLCTLGNYSLPTIPPPGVCLPNPCNRSSDTASTIYSSSCPVSTASGLTCTPTCVNGYAPTGNLTVTCTAGTFSIPSGVCAPLPCAAPTPTYPITLGSCSTSTPSGTTCVLGCAQGYLGNGSLSITCTLGNFSTLAGYCYFDYSRLQCSRPTPPFPFTSANCPATMGNGTTCTLGCAIGYMASGNLNVTCNNQTIIQADTAAECLQNPCILPSLPVGMVQGSCAAIQPGNTSCYYVCSSGYTQVGPLDVACTAGTFSSPFGYCSPNACYQPTIAPSSAQTVGDCAALTPSGSSCTLACIDGFTPVGNMQVTCTAGSFSTTSNAYCVGIADISTSTTSLFNNPPLVASPGTKLDIVLSSLGNIPSDVIISNYSVNGVFADGDFRMPNLYSQNITVPLVVYISSASLSLTNVVLSHFSATILFLEPPTITSACPNQILAQVNQFVIVQGTGFADGGYIRCILNGTVAAAPAAANPTSITCNLFWPVAEVRNIALSIANDGATGNAQSISIPIQIIGACEGQKPGSIAGDSGCVCPLGTFDTGSSCQPCPNGQYQDEEGKTACKQCGSNQDTNYVLGSKSSSACVCSAANYLDIKKNKCLPCVSGMYCPGNNVIEILPGYWRASNTTSAVIRCPGSTASCPGSNSTSSLCATGYTGPECLVCERGYAQRGYICIQCLNTNLNGFALFVLVIFAILLAYFLVKSAAVKKEETFDSSAEKAAKTREGSLQVLIKVTLNYLQVLYYIGRLTSNWSDLSRRFFEAVGIVGALSPQTYTIQCAANWRFYDTLVFIYFSPVVVVVVLTVIYVFVHVAKKRSFKETKTNLQLAVMLLLYQIHPTILLNVISTFPCEAVPGTGTSYLKADYSVDCKSAEYQTYVAISAFYLVFYVFGMMGAALMKLRHNHATGKLHSPAHNAYIKYRFFFMGYRPNTYYWEAVIMLRKMGVVAFSVLASPMLQLVFGNVILVIALYLNSTSIPFASYFVNRLETLSITTLLATVTLGFLFLNAQSTGSNTLWISILLIIINVTMMALLVFYSFQYLRKYIRKLEFLLPKQWRSDADDGNVTMTQNKRSTRTAKTVELDPIPI